MHQRVSGKGVHGLSSKERASLLETLRVRFENNRFRHEGIEWASVQARLEASPKGLWSLSEMERTGGEPDVVGRHADTKEFVFYDCAAQSPKGRRSVCYDRNARESRKKHPPDRSALEMAADMGVQLLSEQEYKRLQELGEFDTKTSSWLLTPPRIRELGGAIFGDFRYATVFIYHNGADSYYAARGFRCSLRV